eukprot:scaffold334_cov91-Isochrysis_galbana.AAC.1
MNSLVAKLKTATTLAKTHGVSTLHALLSANKAGACPRFAARASAPTTRRATRARATTNSRKSQLG